MKTPSAVHISEIGKLRSRIRRAKASAYEDSGLVFATGKGTPLDTQNSINRHFKPLFESAGLPSMGRHTPDGMYGALGLRLGLTFC